MIFDVSYTICEFTVLNSDQPVLPRGPQIFNGKPVSKEWNSINAIVGLNDEVHQWMTDHDIQYRFLYLWDDSPQTQKFSVDIEDLDKAMLFKLTWGGE
jgi:hypothetical protein